MNATVEEASLTPVIKTEKLRHVYSKGTPFEHVALDNIDLEIQPGEVLGVIGHTGSGKSTLIQHLNGLLRPDSGKVFFEGKDVNSSKAFSHSVRFNVGLVFQYPEYQLFEDTVFKDIAFGPKNMGLSEDEIKNRVYEAAEFVALPSECLEKSPFELSGGEKRKAAIAGVIAMRPKVLILDEPTAGLDPLGCSNLMENIRQYRIKNNATVILVTHSMEQIASEVDRLVVLSEGRIILQGKPEEVFSHTEELARLRLAVPEVTEIFAELGRMGVNVPSGVFTLEQAVSAIDAAWHIASPSPLFKATTAPAAIAAAAPISA